MSVFHCTNLPLLLPEAKVYFFFFFFLPWEWQLCRAGREGRNSTFSSLSLSNCDRHTLALAVLGETNQKKKREKKVAEWGVLIIGRELGTSTVELHTCGQLSYYAKWWKWYQLGDWSIRNFGEVFHCPTNTGDASEVSLRHLEVRIAAPVSNDVY